MHNLVKKVIRASAGTGKTYRLSLEYIGLLLRYREQGIHFSEILVITFTRKATAEIRDRVFRHLYNLTQRTPEGHILRENLQLLLGLDVGAPELLFLNTVYQDMLMNKNQVQINTIDAFTNTIFKTVISPYLGVMQYQIDPGAYQDYLEEIYEYLLSPAHLERVRGFFASAERKNLQAYEKLVRDVLNQRWLFPFIAELQESPPVDPGLFLENYRQKYDCALDLFESARRLYYTDLEAGDLLKAWAHAQFLADEKVPAHELAAAMKARLTHAEFIKTSMRSLLRGENFWNGSKLFRKKADSEVKDELTAILVQAGEALAEYMYHTQFLPEQRKLLEMSSIILQKYDELIFRDQVFNYSDISFYTFSHLYDPELSLIQGDEVSNQFYEILTNRTRFMLIDEFQDTSTLQFKILLPMIREIISGAGAKEYGGVIVVGDEKQAIYAWRGGERDLLMQMPDILQQAESVRLNTSFRSDRIIINFINQIFCHPALHERLRNQGIRWDYVPVEPSKTEDAGCVHLRIRNYCQDETGEDISDRYGTYRELIENELLPLLQSGMISLQDTAILGRRNDELVAMAGILDELQINYILESSRSIFEHRAVKPILQLFRALVREDLNALLIFLRSDLVRLDPNLLKDLLLAYRDRPSNGPYTMMELLQQCSAAIPVLQKILQVQARMAELDLLNLCKQCFEAFAVTDLFVQESDAKNIHYFLEIVAGFMQNHGDYANSPSGLLSFCEDHEDRETFQQEGLEEIDALRLLTIHKSKGLEFSTIFLLWDLSRSGGSDSGALSYYLQYQPDYSGLVDYAITYSGDAILNACSKNQLAEQRRRKAQVESLNTLYVAMTRAKSQLFLYFAFNNTKGIDGLWANLGEPDKFCIDQAVLEAVWAVMQSGDSLQWQQGRYISATIGVPISAKPAQEPGVPTTMKFIREYWDTERSAFFQRDPQKAVKEQFIDFKSMYLKKRNSDRGNVVHYYLSFISYATEAAKNFAQNQTMRFYGSLIPGEEIQALIDAVNIFIDDHQEFFDPAKWQRVFTEYTVFGPRGEELRIDRLMIDDINLQVLILDYKTGESYAQEQLDNYIQIVRSLAPFSHNSYQVRGQFVEVAI